ncbi:hypothetical protein ACOSQ2_017433 [Xanthoceras sorbifolium]
MVKFLKPNKAVVVIIKSFDKGTRERSYGHCLVAEIKKYPSKVIRKDSAKKTTKKSRVKSFTNHIVCFLHEKMLFVVASIA